MRKGLIFVILLVFNFGFIYCINYANKVMAENNFLIYLHEVDEPEENNNLEESSENNEVVDYNGESIEKISQKLDKFFVKTELAGSGGFIARTSTKKGVNPYLIGAIILESTNCKRECSIVLRQCNNVSLMKGEPGCFGGTYKKYKSIEDGISDLVNEISKQFDTKESQVPNKMFKSYGKTATWAFKVSNYMEQLKKVK